MCHIIQMRISLPKALHEGPFTYKDACSYGLTQYKLQRLLEAEIIEKLEHGLYRSTGHDLSDEELYRRAIKKVGTPAAVCLLSALSHYDLSDSIPKQIWLMVPKEKRTKSRNIKLYRARDPHWEIGIISKDGYAITSLERTIVDALCLKKLLAGRLGIDALKAAISSKKTSPSKILDMARKLGLRHRILPYIEALS